MTTCWCDTLNPFVLLYLPERKFVVLFQKDGCGTVVNGTVVIVGSFCDTA